MKQQTIVKLEKAIDDKITFLEKLEIDCGLGTSAESVLIEFKKLQTIIESED